MPERVERDICSRMCRSVCPGIPPLAGWAEHPLSTGGSEIKLNGEKRNKWGAFGANSTSDTYAILSSSRARAARSSSLHITAPPRRLRRPPLGTPLFSESACDSRVMRVCRRSAVSHARLLAPSGAAAFGRTGASGAPQPEGRAAAAAATAAAVLPPRPNPASLAGDDDSAAVRYNPQRTRGLHVVFKDWHSQGENWNGALE